MLWFDLHSGPKRRMYQPDWKIFSQQRAGKRDLVNEKPATVAERKGKFTDDLLEVSADMRKGRAW
jgi:hypothetical protein